MNTIVQQSSGQRNQRIAAKSLYVAFGVVAAIELYGLTHEQFLSLTAWEHSVIFLTSFLLVYAYVWLTGIRNIQIKISDSGVEISHDEETLRFSWQEVKNWQQPVVLIRPYWFFELKNADTVKITTRYFSKEQLQRIHNSFATKLNTP